MPKQEEVVKYFQLLDDAWSNLLDDFKNGIFDLPPEVEGPIRGYLFAECLRLMRRRSFEKPYQIWEEESYRSLFPDITLGSLGKRAEKRVLAIEIKYVGACDRRTKKEVERDVRKLGEYSDDTVGSCFVMIDTSQRYKECLNLESLGIKKGCWKWRTVTQKESRPFDALVAWKGELVKY